MRKRDCAILIPTDTDYRQFTYRLAMLLPFSDLQNKRTAHFSQLGLTPHANKSQDLRGYWTKIHKICSCINFLSTVLTQQSALRSIQPLSNEKNDIKKESSIDKTQARRRHRDAGGVIRHAYYFLSRLFCVH